MSFRHGFIFSINRYYVGRWTAYRKLFYRLTRLAISISLRNKSLTNACKLSGVLPFLNVHHRGCLMQMDQKMPKRHHENRLPT